MPKNTTRNRILRTLVQLLAGGAFAGVLTELVELVPDRFAPLTLAVCTLAVAAAQNIAEDVGALRDRRQ